MEKANFSQLLNDAVNQPGIISKCYSTFHGYSIGNQLLAYSQCVARDIPIGPIASFKTWKDLGRSVKKGEKAIALVRPVTIAKKDEAGEKTGEVFSLFTLKNNWFVLRVNRLNTSPVFSPASSFLAMVTGNTSAMAFWPLDTERPSSFHFLKVAMGPMGMSRAMHWL